MGVPYYNNRQIENEASRRVFHRINVKPVEKSKPKYIDDKDFNKALDDKRYQGIEERY